MSPGQFGDMIKELKDNDMEAEAKKYEREMYDIHSNKKDYDTLTGQARPGTDAEAARRILTEQLGHKEEDLYNPLHDEITGLKKLNKSGEFPTTEAADALAQIEGVGRGKQVGHDIHMTYNGRVKVLTGGSGGRGMTDSNAVDEVIDTIVERDVELGHIHEANKDKRRDALKRSLYH